MTVASWPPDLPRPTREGYGFQRGDGRLRRRAAGVPGYRRRFSAVADPVSLMIYVTRSQKAVFDRFYEIDTAGGSLPFYMPDPTTDSWGLFDDQGRPLLSDETTPVRLSAQWLCLFGDTPPQDSIVGVRFDIAFTITVLP